MKKNIVYLITMLFTLGVATPSFAGGDDHDIGPIENLSGTNDQTTAIVADPGVVDATPEPSNTIFTSDSSLSGDVISLSSFRDEQSSSRGVVETCEDNMHSDDFWVRATCPLALIVPMLISL